MPPWICTLSSFIVCHNLRKFQILGPTSLISFSTSTPKIPIFDYLVNCHNFSPECASKVSSLSSTSVLNKPQKADSVLKFLKETGFSKIQIETVLQKLPSVLSASVDTRIKPKIKIFQDLGFQTTDVVQIVSTSPWFLNKSTNRLRESILTLQNVLGPNADISKILKGTWIGKFMANHNLDRTLLCNIEYLKSFGICTFQIYRFVCNYPMIFIVKPEKLKGIVQRVDDMGLSRQSKMFIVGIRVISSLSKHNLGLKFKVFKELGFSEHDILSTFRKAPPVFCVSETKIKEVAQLLLSFGGLEMADIVNNPILLSLSLEKRLKPRIRVLKALETKNFLPKRHSRTRFLRITDADFINRYVTPYPDEIRDLYVGIQAKC